MVSPSNLPDWGLAGTGCRRESLIVSRRQGPFAVAHCCFACSKGSTLTCRVVEALWADGGLGGMINVTTNNNADHAEVSTTTRRNIMMKREDAMKVAEEKLQELAQALEQGRSQVLEDYLAAVARLHKYSFRNLMLITSQCPEAVHVAGFHTWRSMDRTVKKGESGIAILAPLIRRARKEDRPTANIGARTDAQESKTDDSSDPMGYRVVYVFDISQTEGKDFSPVTLIANSEAHALNRLEGVYEQLGITVETKTLGWGTDGVSQIGRVLIQEGLSEAARFSTLAHELAHETMHSEQDRRSGQLSKRQMEVEAEAVAFVVCTAHGIDCRDQSRDYIHLYQGDTKLLLQSINRIQQTAAKILNLMQEPRRAEKTPLHTIDGTTTALAIAA